MKEVTGMWSWGKIEMVEEMNNDFPKGPKSTGKIVPFMRVVGNVFESKADVLREMAKASHRDPDVEYIMVKVVGKMKTEPPHTFTEIEE
jgi:hypothetical protein